MMRNAINHPTSFSRWIGRINAIKRSLGEDDYLQAIASGFQELQSFGTTTVLNIESFPELMIRMAPPPIRTWWFYELIDIRHANATEELVAGALLFFQKRSGWLGGYGLSPHAPYTASSQLYRMAGECAEAAGMLLTSHVAESAEEDDMFRFRRGPLYDFLFAMGRDMSDCGHGSPMEHLLSTGLGNASWILVHLNELDDHDFEMLAAPGLSERLHIVHCPRSGEYFGHRPFQFKRLHNLGLRVSLGTDSLASNDSLNLFSEMQAFHRNEPWLSSEQILRMVTVNPARALKHTGTLGKLVPGAYADMIALPFSGDVSTVFEEIVHFGGNVNWMLVDGEEIQVPTLRGNGGTRTD
jgi:cytosine/adenosine deaminase-related metal-dependent hydrolase